MSFGGMVTFYSHESDSTKTPMNFSVYHPPQEYKVKVPVLFWLSGLLATKRTSSPKQALRCGHLIMG